MIQPIKNKLKFLLVVAFATIWVGGCDFEELSEPDLEWQTELLLPLVKSNVSLQDAANFRIVDPKPQEVTPTELGNIPGTPFTQGIPTGVSLNVPAFTIDHLYVGLSEISDFFTRIEADSIDFTTWIDNPFPMNIKAGTKVVFRTSQDVSSDANIFYEDVVENDVPSGGRFEINVITSDRVVTSDYHLYLEDFATDGGQNLVFDMSKPIKVGFEFNFLKVGRAFLRVNKEESSTDTTVV